jgi:hypothetical protein
MSKWATDCFTQEMPLEPVPVPWHICTPEVLWELVAQMLPLSSAVAFAAACQTTFSAVRGPHGHTTSMDKVVPLSVAAAPLRSASRPRVRRFSA